MYRTGRYLPLMVLGIFLLATACKKEDKTATAPCYWHINDKNHNGELATRITANGLQSKESATELLTVYFPAYPTATKSYKIVNYAKLGSLANDECIVQIDHNAGQLLISTGYDNVKAGIEVAANGKLTITIPKTWSRLYVNGFPQDDSSVIDGFMTEK